MASNMVAARDNQRSAAEKHVVLWDPKGEIWEGALFNKAALGPLHARSVVTLPVYPDLIRLTAVSGYVKRAWGAGWPLSPITPGFIAPLVIMVPVGYDLLHWCARVVPDALEPQDAYRGTLRMAMNNAQELGSFAGAFDPSPDGVVNVAELGEPDELGGWTIYGTDGIRPARPNLFSCGLYGAGKGLRVSFAAISITPKALQQAR